MKFYRHKENKHLPGYMQVYKQELKLTDHDTTAICATDDKSMHTLMIKYTREGTFRCKPSAPNIFGKPMLLIWVIAVLSIASMTLLSERSYKTAIIPVSLLLLITAKAFWFEFHTSKREAISIDKTGISLPETSFNWAEMTGTFIVTRYNGKRRDTFLVLALNNGENIYYPLAAFGNNGPLFATAIKHIKPATSC
ncbi:hypothetical protein [Chitinophaga arvensicola]|uniref:Uncharacterized protein n=1 Tax=Chitinophaga arvensicola TaxID=29529 RepID=A0A1I0QYU7_9BACT|nr:hypothetical protein [Chitinophaga arvensicola]SEW32959.1 hypothetical protein SAMN04488122_1916 [Chitinophaga arvensicola]